MLQEPASSVLTANASSILPGLRKVIWVLQQRNLTKLVKDEWTDCINSGLYLIA